MAQNIKAVICTLNSKYIHSSLAPWCLAAGVEATCNEGIAAEVVEGTINERATDVIVRIAAHAPQVIGFCCYIWNIRQTIEMIGLAKERLPQALIVLGGPEVSYNAEAILAQNLLVDYVISGEGEKPFALLLNAIQHDALITGIPGLCYRKNRDVIVSEPYIGREGPPSPYTRQYFEALNGRIAYLETSRGCPYSCAFCLSGRCGTARYNDIERAKSELLLLANSGTQTVKLVDRTFNANRKRAYEIFDFVIASYGKTIPRGVCIHFEIAGDILDEDTISLLSKAPIGAMQLEIGVQSFHPKTLEAIHRKTDMARLKNNITRLVCNANIHIHIDLIAGLPFEDWKSFRESCNTAWALKPNMLQLGFLKLLHGSPMRENPYEFPCEHMRQPPYEVIKTPWMSGEELLQLHIVEESLERIYNSGRFRRTLEYLLEQRDITPFELLYEFGVFANGHGIHNISLNDYAELIFEYFCKLSNIVRLKLRDAMVCDRLATDSSGVLPRFLQIPDPSLKRVKAELNNRASSRIQEGVKRGYALLYSEACAVYVDYDDKNPVTGEYKLHKYFYLEQQVNKCPGCMA